eukprot:6873768-Ditylum_brightwellii.AAC.1
MSRKETQSGDVLEHFLQCETQYDEGDCAFMTHLKVNHIFINVTKLTTAKRNLWVWCALSHPNQTCTDKAVGELNSRLCIKWTNELNQYLTKGAKEKNIKSTCTTRSLVVVDREDNKNDEIEQLLLFNNLSQE